MLKLNVFFFICPRCAKCVVPKNIHTPRPQGGLLEVPRGKVISKAKFFKGKYEQKLDFPEGLGGGGFNLKNPPWEGYVYFSGTTQCNFLDTH